MNKLPNWAPSKLESVIERREREEAALANMSDEFIIGQLKQIAFTSTSYLTTKQRRILIDAARRMSDE